MEITKETKLSDLLVQYAPYKTLETQRFQGFFYFLGDFCDKGTVLLSHENKKLLIHVLTYI